jgi:hypothetical protein
MHVQVTVVNQEATFAYVHQVVDMVVQLVVLVLHGADIVDVQTECVVV